MAKINNLVDLAEVVGARNCSDFEELIAVISRRLYKDTECGISFYAKDCKSIWLAGYCEGTDAECPGHEMFFPFDSDEFFKQVGIADKEGCDLWNKTHGCEKCGPEDECGNRQVNPKCEKCGGSGMII